MPLEPTDAPFICQSARAPLALRQRMSVLASPLKSAMPATFHDASGATALPWQVTALLAEMLEPFICHSDSAPEFWRHKMSALPSPLKSAVPATFQDASGATAL